MKISSSIQTAFFTVLFTFLFLLLFTKVVGPIPFSVNSVTTTKTDLFTVNGEGEAAAVPDTARVSIGITKTANTVASAKDEVNKVTNEIIESFKKLGVEEKSIKTTNFSVNPNYEYTGSKQTTNGYTVSQDLTIEVKPVDKANEAVDLAAEKGANVVGGVQFVLNDADREKLEMQAREQAIKKAKTKAQDIAGAAGIRLGRIVNIMESGIPAPVMFDKMAMGRAEDAVANQSTQLQPGENTIHVSVTLSYETF
jgi:uncharacterized protein